MSINRRHVISSGLGAAAFFSAGSIFNRTKASEPIIELTAQVSEQKLNGEKSPDSELWSFNGTSPGPEIRVRRGDRVRVRLINKLPQPTSIHWHGIRIANAMDGVAGLTQDAVPPGATFEYDFEVPDAGTYWYHAHNRSWEQVARGLYGAIIVEEDEEFVAPNSDLTLVLDDWLLDPQGKLDLTGLGSLGDWSHGGRLGNWLTVNGKSLPEIELKTGRYYRLRLINACNARTLELDIRALGAQILGYDGQAFSSPEEPAKTPLSLAPAQRVDLLMHADKPLDRNLVEVSGGGSHSFATLKITGNPSNGSVPGLLKSNRLPLPVLDTAQSVKLIMSGGAMGRPADIYYKGKKLVGNDFRKTGQLWAFNGIANLASEALFSAARGETILLEIVNNTVFPHAMHVHGHHFQVLSTSNSSTTEGLPWRDTFLIDPEQSKQIAFVADNPGKWLLHCHMLEHAAAGMNTWFNVS
jgi:FtsP/CotA-like multicopper oxidase with cupredoxin domain